MTNLPANDEEAMIERAENLGGVLKKGWFNVNLMFRSFPDAKIAERELRAAGYVVELLDEIDPYSDATFLTASKPAGDEPLAKLFQQAEALAELLEGEAGAHWIVGQMAPPTNLRRK